MPLKNNKSLGQNWLKDRQTLESIAEIAADFPEITIENPPRLCVEIGPGLGTLTSSLLKRFEKVIAIEFDARLANNLPKSFPGKNLQVKNLDILTFDFDAEISESFVVAGNIPYYITSKILQKLLTLKRKPEKIVLLVQKEVADKICNKTHSSSLSLFVDNYAIATLGPIVKKELFTPAPKVNSRVLILTPRKKPQTPPEENILVFVHHAFQNPRKKLIKNLAFLGLSTDRLRSVFSELGLSLNARPADLTLGDYRKLAKNLKTS